MSEATPIQPKVDNSVEVSNLLKELAAVGDLLIFVHEGALMDNTIEGIGLLVNRTAIRIDQLLCGGAS